MVQLLRHHPDPRSCHARGSGGEFLGDRKGIAAVELAIVAPIFLALSFATLCLGLWLTYVHEVQELAASAARASVAGLTATERDALARAYVTSAVSGSSFLNPNDITVATSQSGSPASSYVVSVSYTLNDTPIPSIARIASLSMTTITSSSTIAFGGY